ncbi:MAG: Crp/Fnr family transcriptional regulator [Sedimentitalea sp.]|uniref:Crp/Fnr family transcriptional regulator n=1 Tax=Sedimentitalea sp. TaxID=2048915 RepID=UPI003263A267
MDEWHDLDADELAFVTRVKRDHVFEPGEVIFHQGAPCDGMYWVRTGLTGERRLDPDGEMALVRLGYAGGALGYQELLTGKPYRNSAEALKRTATCYLSHAAIRELLDRNTKLRDRFLQRCVRDHEKTEKNLVAALNRGVRTRFLYALLKLYERYGQFVTGKGHILELPIARKDLAALVGTGPESISRTIRKLERDRIASFDGRTVFFPDLGAVQDEIHNVG